MGYSFPQADRMGGDEIFAETFRICTISFAMFEDGKGNYPATPGTVVLGNDVGGIMSQGVKAEPTSLIKNALQGLPLLPQMLIN